MLFSGPFEWLCKFLLMLIPSVSVSSNGLSLDPLLEIVCFGVWVVGVDLISLILSSAFLWLTTRLSVGLVLWIWDLLPFT